ncbi:MAG TPA: Rieske 2Fe-2S domain-containing protein [Chloroflexota bacterium]|nr:Rieske 2Fe-2S domain-containing protein [Chloroflexota bacterium]
MLTKEENELICHVGPGTPMGNLMRQYWIPAMLSREVTADGDPLRVQLLGEQLIAFRDSTGQVGLIQNACPHRGASLFFGRNEDRGLRCVYHGWKFEVSGACVDMPNEPAESNFKQKIKATAYPCVERGGLVWTYMGPREAPPPLPNLEANLLPEEETAVNAVLRECNWLQALEGDIDTSHFGFLHRGSVRWDELEPGTFQYYALRDRAPHYAMVDTNAGAMYGGYRDADEGHDYWRIAHFLFPFYTMAPGGMLGMGKGVICRVPMDDEHTMNFTISPRLRGRPGPIPPGSGTDPAYERMGRGMLPNTTDWHGRFRMAANRENDFDIDREMQRRNRGNNGYTGIVGNEQDQAITESMGPIVDRTLEHLGTADVMIIRVRRRLIAAAQALADSGTVPPGVDHPDVYLQRSGGAILPKGADWIEATADLRKPFSKHPELNLAIANA